MQKYCIICQKPAVYIVRGTNNAYCEEHAKECFGDTSYLASIKEEAERLKKIVDSQIDQLTEVKDGLEQKDDSVSKPTLKPKNRPVKKKVAKNSKKKAKTSKRA